MIKTPLCLLLVSLCFISFSQTSNNSANQEKAYADFFSLAMNNWCGVFSGHNSIDPCFYSTENAQSLTGKEYLESQHLRLLRSAIRCKSNQHRLESLDCLMNSSLLDEGEKLALIQYTYACHKASGKTEKELKQFKKILKTKMDKDSFNNTYFRLTQHEVKNKNYQSLIHTLNEKIREYKSNELNVD